MHKLKLFLPIITLFILILGSNSTFSQENIALTTKAAHEEAQIELIVGGFSSDGGKNYLDMGLLMNFKENWKTYWRTPGDGGLAKTFDWTGSENIGDVEVMWPAPKRSISFETIENFVYYDQVVIPLRAEIKEPELAVKIQTAVNYAVCEEICVFFTDNLATVIVPGFANTENIALINSYKDRIPRSNGEMGLNIDPRVTITNETEKGGTLEVNTTSEQPFTKPDLIVEANPNLRFPKAKIDFSNGKKTATFKIPYEILVTGQTLADQPITLTLVDGDRAVEKSIKTGQVEVYESLVLILLFAFIGGLILNIMPCVLPVLSLKLLGVINHGGKHHKRVRASFLASAAGIITSFLIIAAIVVGIQSAGTAIGWGFHFQEPLFLITMVLIMTIFAANMWGLFEIQTPQFISKMIPKEDDHTLMGHFMLGGLATLLATPCSAPFLGTAIGYAFTQGTGAMFITFFFMGVGLAFPYLLLALKPKLVSKLPKPGSWMVKVKYALGIFLAATAIWLITIVAGSMGMRSAITLLLLSIIIIFLFITLNRNLGKKRIGIFLILGTIVLSYYVPTSIAQKDREVASKASSVWAEFDQNKIQQHVANGKVVFVDVTADWCITCDANKFFVLHTKDIMDVFEKDHVVAMQADWTKPNEAIRSFLASYNRHGIPFNIVYGPSAKDGIVLSELLTKGAVKEAIEKAK